MLKEDTIKTYLSKKDKESLSEIYKETSGFVYRYIYKNVGNKDWAMDIMSETYITFTMVANKFNFESKLETFLIGIARNKILQFLSKNKSEIQADSYIFTGEEGELDNLEENEYQKNKDNEDQEKLKKVLVNISEDYRNILEQRFIEGKSIQDCAEDLGISEENVRVRTHRALKKAQEIILNESEHSN